MRPFTYNIYPLWLCFLLLLSACMQEDLQSVPNEGEGVLKLGLSARAELSSVLTKATIDCPVAENEIPTQEDFIIKVMDSQGIVQYEGSFKASIVCFSASKYCLLGISPKLPSVVTTIPIVEWSRITFSVPIWAASENGIGF